MQHPAIQFPTPHLLYPTTNHAVTVLRGDLLFFATTTTLTSWISSAYLDYDFWASDSWLFGCAMGLDHTSGSLSASPMDPSGPLRTLWTPLEPWTPTGSPLLRGPLLDPHWIPDELLRIVTPNCPGRAESIPKNRSPSRSHTLFTP
jgi:hypothetical protein